jgi:dTMP kinase
MALMFASRAQHIEEIVLPALSAGRDVLCDRFTDSTEAYQGHGRRLGSEAVLSLHRVLCRNLQPDLTILLDCDLDVSLRRARRRNQASEQSGQQDENRFERENRAFFTRVRDGYHAIAQRDSNRVVIIDARGAPEETHAKIVTLFRQRFGKGAKAS